MKVREEYELPETINYSCERKLLGVLFVHNFLHCFELDRLTGTDSCFCLHRQKRPFLVPFFVLIAHTHIFLTF